MLSACISKISLKGNNRQFTNTSTKLLGAYCTILFLIDGLNTFPRHFALLPHWHKRSTQPERDGWTNQETTRIKTDNNINPFVWCFWRELRSDMMHKMRDKRLKREWIAKNWKEILENDSL